MRAESRRQVANVIDTHAHVLPWLDHGSSDLEMTVRMVREAADRGTRTIVCTPHLYDMDARLVERARDVQRVVAATLDERGIPVRLLLGFEVDLAIAATNDLETLRGLCIGVSDFDAAKHKDLEPRAERRTGDEGDRRGDAVLPLLLEMPYQGWPFYLEETVFRLTTSGFMPILAHPERNERVQRSPDVLAASLSAGALAQGTAGSLSSMFRKRSAKTFHELLARGWFSLLASDAHSDLEYTWSLEPLQAELGKRVSPEDWRLLTELNPARVLAGKQPLPLQPSRGDHGGRRRFF